MIRVFIFIMLTSLLIIFSWQLKKYLSRDTTKNSDAQQGEDKSGTENKNEK